jgi:long-chain acyl-CoA synthetase
MPDTPGTSLPPEPSAPRRLLHDGLIQQGGAPAERDRIAVLADGRTYSFGDLLDCSQRLAAAFCGHGVRRGDRVAIFLDNSWPCVVSIYAALISGTAFVLINPQTKEEKLEFILRDSGARVLVASGRLAHVFGPGLERLRPSPTLICASRAPEGTGIESFESAVSPRRSPAQQIATIPLDLAAIIYTSGSTGTPKGVMHTHQSMVFAVGALIQYLRLTADEKILCALPLSFDYGLYQLLMSVWLGATLVLERSFTYPAEVYARIRDERVTVLPGVPTMFATLLATHQRSPLSFPSVRRVTNTAAALADEYVPGLREMFPNALIYKMYGLTECKRVSYLEPELIDARPGSVGKAIPGTEAYILTQSGAPAAPGETGMLYVRGPHVMAGYWNRPDLTAHMLRPGRIPGERVLCTQDLFKMDEDGFLYFVGRTDDIIKARGQKVSPIEVESALHRIPGVREAAVIGVPDALLGEAVRAYVVVDSQAELTAEEIRARSAQFLESHMVPAQVILTDSLPKSEHGKVQKRLLLAAQQPRLEAD